MGVNLRARLRTGLPPEFGLLLGFVSVSFVLALTDFNHYGSSWDEDADSRYAREALSAYRGRTPDWASLGAEEYLELHGPAYLMASELAAHGLVWMRHGWFLADARHFTNHVMFLVAVVFTYLLGEGLAGRRVGLLGAILLLSQPLLLGHSFINQKDIPFMALFLIAMVQGFRMRRARQADQSFSRKEGDRRTQSDWRQALAADAKRASRKRKVAFLLSVLFAAALAAELLWLNRLIFPFLRSTVAAAYEGQSAAVLNDLFRRVAQNAGRLPISSYIDRTTWFYRVLRFIPIALALAGVWLAGRSVFPSVLGRWRARRRLDGKASPAPPPLVLVVIAGATLGLAVSTRSLGVFAGILVTLMILRQPGRSWASVLIYWAVAALVCTATWPYLWGNPWPRFVESVRTMTAFPWQGDILYRGALWDAHGTPWHYLPFLLAVQMTVPFLGIALVGVGVAVVAAVRRSIDRFPILVLLGWFSAPIIAAVALHSTVYDNTRQFLFVLPPIFVLAGLGLEATLRRTRRPLLQVLIVGLVLAPGILAILQLHPYEYIYYNEFVGGTRGAFRRYETDYWCTSYRQAIEKLNDEAPPGSSIALWGPLTAAADFARPDLILRSLDDGEVRPDFALACTRTNHDLDVYPESSPTWQVEGGGAVLTVVKDLRIEEP
ncbi:MAG TPA: hypothetical protein VI701_00155 [Anaerolineales bacterium]|nr:hypothetical protein [Anaerolineales bacterium]